LLDRQKRSGIHGSINYEIAARAYHHANMPDRLRQVYADAVSAKADDGALHAIMLQFAWEKGDTAAVEREIAWSRGKPEESHILQYAALAALAGGQVRRAEALFAEATVAAQRDKLQDTLADLDDYHARMLVELGLDQEARKLLNHLPPADSSLDKACAEAEVGDAAQALAEAQRQKDTNDVLMNVEYAPSVRAAVALRQGKPGEAIALLQADARYDLRDPTVPYLRGQAYLAAHQALPAAAEFEKLADRPWLAEPAAPVIALAHLGLARASALEGNQTGSRNEYEKFFALWKDADPDVPVLLQARRDYDDQAE
jgi:tetratricopeptide (TPR) repeat protein